jgi:hypothetical protein
MEESYRSRSDQKDNREIIRCTCKHTILNSRAKNLKRRTSRSQTNGWMGHTVKICKKIESNFNIELKITTTINKRKPFVINHVNYQLKQRPQCSLQDLSKTQDLTL